MVRSQQLIIWQTQKYILDVYKRQEFHYQRAYELQRVAALLEQAGLTLKAVCAEGTTDPADENCERAYFVAVRTQPHVF